MSNVDCSWWWLWNLVETPASTGWCPVHLAGDDDFDILRNYHFVAEGTFNVN